MFLCSRRVCDCELGFGAAAAARKGAGAAAALEGFLADPWLLRPPGAGAGDGATVQVEVPPLDPGPEDGEGEARRAAAQRGADAAEDLARRLESGAYGSPVSGSLISPPLLPSSIASLVALCLSSLGFALLPWCGGSRVSLALVLCPARPGSCRSVCRTVDVGSSWAVEVWIRIMVGEGTLVRTFCKCRFRTM